MRKLFALDRGASPASHRRRRDRNDQDAALELERRETVEKPYSSRVIDLDILLFGDATVNEPDLVIPHPRMNEREFVMMPLRELTRS